MGTCAVWMLGVLCSMCTRTRPMYARGVRTRVCVRVMGMMACVVDLRLAKHIALEPVQEAHQAHPVRAGDEICPTRLQDRDAQLHPEHVVGGVGVTQHPGRSIAKWNGMAPRDVLKL